MKRAPTRPADRSLRAANQGTGRARALRWAKWITLAALAAGAIGATTLAVLFWYYGADPDLPRMEKMSDYHPKEVLRVRSSDGKTLGEIFEERRTFVALDKISPLIVNAVIDAEDASFREHGGIDLMGMLRALYVNVRAGETRQGGSTITQQVVKTILLTPERTLRRKVQEVLLARRLEHSLTKDEILTLYLNQIYFGHGRYGVEEAARFFYGKSAIDVDVGEAALLAGLPQSPERLSPLKHPDAAKSRQTYVLEQMARRGHLTDAEAKRWIAQPIRIVAGAEPHLGDAPEILDLARAELTRRGPAGASMRAIETTIRADVQSAAREALETGLRALDARHNYGAPLAKLGPDAVKKKLAALTKKLPKEGPGESDSYDGVVVEVSDAKGAMLVDLGGWKGAVPLGGAEEDRYNPKGKAPSARFAAGDVVRVRRQAGVAPELEGAKGRLALALGPQGAIVVLDPGTRNVLAVVGGYDYTAGAFDRATTARRQPGSAFKPIVYAAAYDSGMFTPATIVNDAPEVYDLWKPKNYEGGKFRGPVRLRDALANSINTVAIRVLKDVGPDRVVELAHALGIQDELPRELSLALGSGVVTPLELTNAFATFAAGGRWEPPVFFTGEGAPPKGEPRQALRPEIAYLVTSTMTSVVEEGTAQSAKKLKRPIAGKTGTSNEGKDAWFVGFTPDLVIGVWIGFDDMRSLGKGETGGKAAVPIFVDVAKVALKNRAARAFQPPPGVVTARIDKKTGKLAPPGAPDAEVMEEVFLEGTVPTEVAPAQGEVDPSSLVLDELNGEESMTAPPAPEPPPP